VRTGISDGTLTEILEGALESGDQVVTDAPDASGGTPSGMAARMRRPF
jgi:hypothetical protein